MIRRFDSGRPTNRKILLVDREHELQGPLIVKLRRAGFDTVTARSGIDALRIAKEQPLALAIIDPHIQEMTGAKLGGMLREKAGTPFLFLTDRSTCNYEDAAIEAGALTILSKRLHPDDLVTQIQLALKHAIEAANTQKLNERLHRKVNDNGNQERLIGCYMEKWDMPWKNVKRILNQFARSHRLSIDELADAHASHREALSEIKREYAERMAAAQPTVLVELSLFHDRNQSSSWPNGMKPQESRAQ